MSAIPVFIPYLNRPDLLERALASVPRRMTTRPIIINNSGEPLPMLSEHIDPPVPLTFTQTQNLMLKMAEERNVPFYMFMHNDAEAGPDTIEELYRMALKTCCQGKWGAIFTSYDALAAFNTSAMRAVGGWDANIKWYTADNDCYRRLRLAGYSISDSGLPVTHNPSQTINSDPLIKRVVDIEIQFRDAYYCAKWGGLPGKERFDAPWGAR